MIWEQRRGLESGLLTDAPRVEVKRKEREERDEVVKID